MSSVTLHSPPSYGAVMHEQLRSVGLSLRKEGVFFLGLLSLVGVLVISVLLRLVGNKYGIPICSTGSVVVRDIPADMLVPFVVLIPSSFVVAILPYIAGLSVPLGVWRAENPSHRSYHWAMPIERGPHTLMKVFAGWLWLMAALAIYGAFVFGILSAAAHILECPYINHASSAWNLVILVAGPSIIYLLTSATVILSSSPRRWIGRLAIVYVVALGCFKVLGLNDIFQMLGSLMTGDYGLLRALFGYITTKAAANTAMVEHNVNVAYAVRTSISDAWINAVLLWTVVSCLAVCFASYHRKDA